MLKPIVCLITLTFSFTLATGAVPLITSTQIGPKLTATMCTRDGGMIKKVKGKMMCITGLNPKKGS